MAELAFGDWEGGLGKDGVSIRALRNDIVDDGDDVCDTFLFS